MAALLAAVAVGVGGLGLIVVSSDGGPATVTLGSVASDPADADGAGPAPAEVQAAPSTTGPPATVAVPPPTLATTTTTPAPSAPATAASAATSPPPPIRPDPPTPPTTIVVRGHIFLSPPATFGPATVHVRLEDVSLADAPSRILARQVIHVAGAPPPGSGIPYALTAEAQEVRAIRPFEVGVSAHVDVDGDSRFSQGDYLTQQRYTIASGFTVDITAKPM
jgi:uncharacterized lipoprotein YbaY